MRVVKTKEQIKTILNKTGKPDKEGWVYVYKGREYFFSTYLFCYCGKEVDCYDRVKDEEGLVWFPPVFTEKVIPIHK